MRMRAVDVRVRRFLFLPAVVVLMSVAVGLRDRMPARIPLMPVAVVMVVAMRG